MQVPCTLCGCHEGPTDWIACDKCDSWLHFSCDTRRGLGTFADYTDAEQPRSYTCPDCARSVPRRQPKVGGKSYNTDVSGKGGSAAKGGQASP